NAPETVSGWTISGNNYAAAGVNIPSPVLLNNITLDTVGKLVDGDSHSGTYTPTVTGVANIDTVGAPVSCHYVRIGKIVQVYGSLILTFNTLDIICSLAMSLTVLTNQLTFSNNFVGPMTCNQCGFGFINTITVDTHVRISFTSSYNVFIIIRL